VCSQANIYNQPLASHLCLAELGEFYFLSLIGGEQKCAAILLAIFCCYWRACS